MAATSGYQAGVESNALVLSYGIEQAWGTPPSAQFQAIRLTAESLARTKTRSRPAEINTTGEVSAAVTTADTAAGAINFALSFGTYDDFLSCNIRNDWQAAQTITGSGGDITITNASSTTATLSSTTSTKFQNIGAGAWIRLLGFTNAANNGFFYVVTKSSNSSLTIRSTGATPVTETPSGSAAGVRASTIQNGTQFKSLFLQKRFSASLYLTYAGAFCDTFTLSCSTGQFVTGTFNFLTQGEVNKTTDSSTGSVLAAPTGTVNNPVGDFKGVYINEVAAAGVCDQFTLSFQNAGAAVDYGLGSAIAQGVRMGLMTVTGTARFYFKDFSLYTLFANETGGRIEFITCDDAGNAYVITLLNGKIMNPKIVAGGPNQPVYATFDLEGNPQAGSSGTIQIDRLPAT
jgi:hypothetical protein